jgi:F-type H+-transporting ATPase subunit delta
MQTDALAHVYAKSLYELAETAGGQVKIAEIGGELEQICELARGDRALREFLASPIIDRAERAESLGRMFRDRITDLTLRFLLVLNHKGRLSHLESITAAYDSMVQEAQGRVEVDVFTAAPLGNKQLRLIGERVKAAISREPVLHAYTDETMIGGLRLRIGDQLIDGSVATRLRRMRETLMTDGAAAIRQRFSEIIEEGGA